MRAALILLAVGAPGCILHQHVDTRAPGHVSLDEPPPAAPATLQPYSSPAAVKVVDPTPDVTSVSPAHPTDPGEEGVILGGSLMGGYASGLDRGERRNGGHLQVEASLLGFSQEKTHRGWITPKVLNGSTRVALGLGLRIYDDQGTTYARPAPIYVEAQHTRVGEIWGGTIGLGAAFSPLSPRAVGPQLTGCFGIPLMVSLCGRGAYLVGQGHEITIMMGYHGFVERVWSR